MFDAAAARARGSRVRAALRRRTGAALWDGGLAVGLAVASYVPQLAGNGLQFGQLAARQGDAWAVLLTLGQCLPLSVRRRWSEVCLVIVARCFAAYQLLGYRSDFASVGLFVALYSAGAHAHRLRRVLAAVVTAAYLVLALTLHGLGSPERAIDYCTFYVALIACWGAGAWMRGRQAAEDGRRREEARAAMEQERTRIAMDLHDVVTHHVAGIVVQADAAQYLTATAPDRVADSLSAIGGTGRRALAELRHLLGVLDSPREPRDPLGTPAGGTGRRTADEGTPGHEETPGHEGTPGAGRPTAPGRYRDLVERTRLVGQPVELFEDGEPASVAAGPELAGYRVVQEALTNAVKHAPGRRTVVRVQYGEEIQIDVTTEGPVIVDGSFTAGRGLTGLRERVSACGGELVAGGRPGGGFGVRARMPSGPGR